jgi:hypothetical protein
MLRRIFWPEREVAGGWRHIVWSFVICMLWVMYFYVRIREHEMSSACSKYEKNEKYAQNLGEHLLWLSSLERSLYKSESRILEYT